ncbi:MAG: site-specific integrase [Polyangiaceae bacterium]|nr:site-specific integrase [Polyangiaceae bacterium]
MGFHYPRHNTLWIGFKSPDGKWVRRRTNFRVGEEDKAEALIKKLEERIGAGNIDEEGVMTVERYARRWLAEFQAINPESSVANESILRLHVLPVLGPERLDAVRPRHIAALFRQLRAGNQLAPKTIRNIYSVVRGIFREAAIAGFTDTNPCILTEHHLGPITDKHPEWRSTAVFTREELVLLTTSPLVVPDRRMLYALEGIGALRHGEAAGLRWRHYDRLMAPLARLTIATSYDRGRTKTNRERWMPVHPVLQAKLDDWRSTGWIEMMGRVPGVDDLVIPCPSRPRMRLGQMRDKNYSRKRFLEDLAALELRHRRGHDLRRTMISLARSDGARKDLLEVCTHTPGRGQTAIDVYTTFEWPALCAEVAKLQLPMPER